MTSSDKIAYIKRYFELMTAAHFDSIIDMFEPDGYVVSPFLGKLSADQFFRTLGGVSSASKLTVFDVLLGDGGDSGAAHFEYDWTLNSGEQFVFQGIDYFKFSQQAKFASMSIFYDTYPVREIVGDKYSTD